MESQTKLCHKLSCTLPVLPRRKYYCFNQRGGNVALPGDFPFNVGIYDSPSGPLSNNSILCGGVILTTTLVLTAAHCLDGKLPGNFRIVAGEHDVNRRTGREQIRLPKFFYMHEKFSRMANGSSHDIGLILISEAFRFTKYVDAIALPKRNEEFNGWLTLMGFGYITEATTRNAYKLRHVRVPIVSQEDCRRSYESRSGVISDDMLCAGEYGRDSCKGDSGGPAVCYRSVNEPVLCGIVSWGFGCGSPGYPGINMKVSHYVDWIAEAEKRVAFLDKCRSSEFYCSPDLCIPREGICNGTKECSGGEDEQGCPLDEGPCIDSFWRCRNGKCISKRYLCDSDNDCRDGSDEWKCPKKSWTCGVNEFQCGFGGRCISNLWRCDGLIDCDNSFDELGCNAAGIPNSLSSGSTHPCPGDQFHCHENLVFNQCIPTSWLCDGQVDCTGGYDEQHCASTNSALTTGTNIESSSCTSEEFFCPGNRMYSECIPRHWRCDGEPDCTGNLDEQNCHPRRVVTFHRPSLILVPIYTTPTCSPDTFTCANGGRCLPISFKCDDDEDCLDGSDEEGCYNRTSTTTRPTTTTTTEHPDNFTCDIGDFACKISMYCLPLSFICDDDIDCPDGSDEMSCATNGSDLDYTSWEAIHHTCYLPGRFSCDDDFGGRCLPVSFRCDDDEDCIDGTDESGCSDLPITTTTERVGCYNRLFDTFQCSNGQCIRNNYLCDGENDCSDGSDELGCDARNTTGVLLTRRLCPENYIPCRVHETIRMCVKSELWCDGSFDCPGGLDERNCAIAKNDTTNAQNIESFIWVKS